MKPKLTKCMTKKWFNRLRKGCRKCRSMTKAKILPINQTEKVVRKCLSIKTQVWKRKTNKAIKKIIPYKRQHLKESNIRLNNNNLLDAKIYA